MSELTSGYVDPEEVASGQMIRLQEEVLEREARIAELDAQIDEMSDSEGIAGTQILEQLGRIAELQVRVAELALAHGRLVERAKAAELDSKMRLRESCRQGNRAYEFQTENARLSEALEFYAHRNHWYATNDGYCIYARGDTCGVKEDLGETARAALSPADEVKNKLAEECGERILDRFAPTKRPRDGVE